jgi:CO dehydrogenase maturation factor
MKIAVGGKGGSGKTTVAGTLARAIGRSGRAVVALDADSNPMLGLSLGLGPGRTEELVGLRQRLDAGEVEHETTVGGLVDRFGADAPDGVRVVVCSRIDQADPG